MTAPKTEKAPTQKQEPTYFFRLSTVLNRIKHEIKQQNTARKIVKRRSSATSLIQLMKASQEAVTAFLLANSVTSPTKPRPLPISSDSLHSPSKAILSTPEKGASASHVVSPNGSRYDNQGNIQILKNGRRINCSLFFPQKAANSNNTISFPLIPPDNLEILQAYFKSLASSDKTTLSQEIEITLDSLIKIHSEGKKRCPSNRSVMKMSAEDAFKRVFQLPKGARLHWLHRKATCLAGEYDKVTNCSQSQNSQNLILGTCEANAEMALVELAIKKMLKKPELNIEVIYLDEKVIWKPGYEGVIADKIIYTLKANGNEITFNFNPWTRNKIPDNKEELIDQIIEHAFSPTISENEIVEPSKVQPLTPLYTTQKRTASPASTTKLAKSTKRFQAALREASNQLKNDGTAKENNTPNNETAFKLNEAILRKSDNKDSSQYEEYPFAINIPLPRPIF